MITASYKDVQSQINMLERANKKLLKSIESFIDCKSYKVLTDEISSLYVELKNKYEEEIEKRHRPPNTRMDYTAVYNHTGIMIPEDILMTGSWGRKFLFPFELKENNLQYYLAELEFTLEGAIPSALREMVARDLRKEIDKSSRLQGDPTIQWLNFLKYRTEKFLKHNKNIRIIDSDKGACSMFIDVKEYELKVSSYMSDKILFEELYDNPITEIIEKEKYFISILRENPKTKDLVGIFEPNTLNLAKFYGTLKHHKSGHALRPIISTIGSPGYALGKTINLMLKNIFPPSARHIQDIRSFKAEIDNLKIGPQHRLVSFDVVSMYTNIAPDLVLQIINKSIHKFKLIYDLPNVFVLRALTYVLKETTIFQTNEGKIFNMKTGLPMGGPISAICSRIVIDEILNWIFTHINPPIFHKVYVDDSIFVVEKNESEQIYNLLNSYSKALEFTVEHEKDGKINFLNMTLFRDSNKIITNWYRKEFASKRLLNYYSAHKRTTILNTATHFVKTVIDLSDGNFFQINRPMVENTLYMNNFPETTIMSIMNEFYTLMKPTHDKNRTENKESNLYVSYPHTIKNTKFKSIIREFAYPRVVLAESVKNTKINFIDKLKYKTPLEDLGNVIATGKCSCGEKSKTQLTKYNENGRMLIDRLTSINRECMKKSHAFRKFNLRRGLFYKGQSAFLVKQINWVNRTNVNEITEMPNKYFRL